MSEAVVVPAVPTEAGEQISKSLVLVVKSDSSEREFLNDVLSLAGIRTILVRTVKDGLNCLKELPVSAVITGYRLPDGTGEEVIAHAKSINPELPVLLFSSSRSDELLQELVVKYGFIGYINKDKVNDPRDIAKTIIEAMTILTSPL